MATSLSTPPPPLSVPATSLNSEELLISITPWTTRTTSKINSTPNSLSPSKRITRSSRNSLAVVADENDQPQLFSTTTTTPGNKSRTLMDSFTPSCKQTNLSTPLVPSNSASCSYNLLRSALKKTTTTVPLQSRSLNSPSSTPVRTGGVAFPTITTENLEGCSAGTPNNLRSSPTKTLRFDQEVIEREEERVARKSKKGKRSLNTIDGDDEEEWVSETDEDADADVEASLEISGLHSAPATPIPSLPSHLLPQTPSAYTFSPATPLVRTHGSYDEDELTDCDADFSVYEEESSFAFTNIGKQQQTVSNQKEEIQVGADVESPDEVAMLEQDDGKSSFEDEPNTDEEMVEETETSEVEVAVNQIDEEEDTREASLTEQDETVPSAPEIEIEDKIELDKDLSEQELNTPINTREQDSKGDAQNETEVVLSSEEEEATLESSATPEEEVELMNDSTEGTPFETRSVTPDQQLPIVASPPSPFLDSTPPAPILSTKISSPISDQVVLGSASGRPVTPSKADPRTQSSRSTPVANVSTTPGKSTIPCQPFRPTQPQVHDAPTAKRQLTKLSSLASKRSNEGLQSRTTGLSAIVPGSASSGSRRVLVSTKPSSLAPPSTSASSSTGAFPRPTSSVSRLAQPTPAGRSKPAHDLVASQLATVNENQPPSASAISKSTKLSSSLPSSLKPPTSTIPRPRGTFARSGLKPPTPSTASAILTIPSASISARNLPPSTLSKTSAGPTTKPSRPLTSSLSRPVAPSRQIRPELPLPSPAPRQLPSLQQTSSAPSILGSSRGPTPPLQQSKANHLPPVPRSARPANHSRPTSASAPLARSSSPQKQRATEPSASSLSGSLAPGPARSEESSAQKACLDAAQTLPPLPSSPIPSRPPVTEAFSPRRTPIERSPRKAGPSSPLRSPRRVPISHPSAPAFPSSSARQMPLVAVQPSSALVLPADKLASTTSSAPSDVFGSAPPQPLPARSSRIRSARPIDENVAIVSDPIPTKRLTRRTAAAAQGSDLAAPSSLPAKPSAPLIPRSARRPRKPSPAPELGEAESPVESAPSPENDLPLPLTQPSAPRFIFNPAPVLTQEELSRLTTRNSLKNQKPFNKIKFEVVHLDENRPPSPDSKVRRMLGAENGGGAQNKEAAKESREARAARRRRALRSSTDGSELERLQAELGQADGDGSEEVKVEPLVHFRAPGDEEQFCSPARPIKKSGKKKSSTTTAETKKSVRWDKALVYEGPLAETPSASTTNGILKQIPLDIWGNSTDKSTNFAKPSPVVIIKRIWKNDEQ
ncbi:hypothetical protein JCM3765_001603 [Sporobolomyces pararoseus]